MTGKHFPHFLTKAHRFGENEILIEGIVKGVKGDLAMIQIDRNRVAGVLQAETESFAVAEDFLRALANDDCRYLESGTTAAEKLWRIYQVKLQPAEEAGIELIGADNLLAQLTGQGAARIRIFHSQDSRYTYVLVTNEAVAEVVACIAIGDRKGTQSAEKALRAR